MRSGAQVKPFRGGCRNRWAGSERLGLGWVGLVGSGLGWGWVACGLEYAPRQADRGRLAFVQAKFERR